VLLHRRQLVAAEPAWRCDRVAVDGRLNRRGKPCGVKPIEWFNPVGSSSRL